jgi:hypothetical protein
MYAGPADGYQRAYPAPRSNGRTVETPRQIGGHNLEVLRSRLDQVDDGDLFALSKGLCQAEFLRTSGIIWRVVPMFRCMVTWEHVQHDALQSVARCSILLSSAGHSL